MIAVDIFVDTNILIYAHDLDAGDKHDNTLVRKGISTIASADTVRRYLSWRVIHHTTTTLRRAFDVQRRWQLTFWNAAIVAAAQQAGATTLWSEDLTTGQDYGGVTVVNPLQDASSTC